MSIHEANRKVMSAEVYRPEFVDLCKWIHANADQRIGWTHLMEVSGLSHKELISFFMYFLQTTPMAYIRAVRSNAATPHLTTSENLRLIQD